MSNGTASASAYGDGDFNTLRTEGDTRGRFTGLGITNWSLLAGRCRRGEAYVPRL